MCGGLIMNDNQRVNISYSALQCVYWMNGSILIGFLLPFLITQGFAEMEAGLMMAVTSLFGFFLPALFSKILEAGRIRKLAHLVMILLLFQLMLCTAFLFFYGRGKISVAIYLLLAGVHMSMYPLYVNLAALVMRQNYAASFARARAFGSLGFAVMSLLMGGVMAAGDTQLICRIINIVLVTQILLLLFLMPYETAQTVRTIERHKAKQNYGGRMSVLILLIGLAFVFSGDSATNSFRYTILTSLGGSIAAFGTLTAFKGAMEIPVMFLYPYLRRIGSGKLLTVSVIFFFIKLVMMRLACSVATLYIAFFFQALSFGLYTPAVVDYITENVHPDHVASVRSLGSGMNCFGSFGATILTGYLLSNQSVRFSLDVLLAVEAVGLACYVFSREKIKNGS